MGLKRNHSAPVRIFNFGLVLVIALFFITVAEQPVAANVIPQETPPVWDSDSRIDILRRSVADEGEGMQDALKYLEELDKYYAQVARPR